MKRIIVIYGNIASGKSTVIKELEEILPGMYQKVGADLERARIFRKMPELPGIKREALVRSCLRERFEENDWIIFETSLSGKYDRELLEKHTGAGSRIWYFYLHITKAEAFERHHLRGKRGYFMPPWPYKGQNVKTSVDHMALMYRHTQKDATFHPGTQSAEDIALKIAEICLKPTPQ